MVDHFDGIAADGRRNGKIEWREIEAFETAMAKERGLDEWPPRDKNMVNRIFHHVRGDDWSVDEYELEAFLY